MSSQNALQPANRPVNQQIVYPSVLFRFVTPDATVLAVSICVCDDTFMVERRLITIAKPNP